MIMKKLLMTQRSVHKQIVRSKNITVMDDINCKEMSWEDWTTEEGKTSCRNKLLQLAMDNILKHSGLKKIQDIEEMKNHHD